METWTSNVLGLSFKRINWKSIQNTYQLEKYLEQLLSPLGPSQYKSKSTRDFIERIYKVDVHREVKTIPFDVKSFFTSVALFETSNETLDRIICHQKNSTYQKVKTTCIIYYCYVPKMSTFVLVVTYKYYRNSTMTFHLHQYNFICTSLNVTA